MDAINVAVTRGGIVESRHRAPLLDTFRLGLTGYTSQPAYAPDDRDGTGLLALGQEGINIVVVEYDRDGAKYASACLTVVELS